MHIEILKAGFQTTIQDQGRRGWMHLGFSRSGVMDPLAAKLANLLVDQSANNPVIEFTLVGPDMVFHGDFQIAITGAQCQFDLNSSPVDMYKTLTVHPGDKLQFKGMASGCRGYIAFRQPIQISQYLGSVATHLNAGVGGLAGRSLKVGDYLDFGKCDSIECQQIKLSKQPRYTGNYLLRITETAESGYFSTTERQAFVNEHFEVSHELNRMGIRLQSAFKVETALPEMKSRGLLPGAIQIPPDNAPIIAASDAQTTGGYSRIAQIIQTDLPMVGQLKPGDKLRFQWLDLTAARDSYRNQQRQITTLVR